MCKILFLSTSNLTTNPRMLKEIEYYSSKGHNAHVICFDLNNWSEKIDKSWMDLHLNISVTKISAKRKPFIKWFISSSLEWFYKKIYFIFQKSIKINSYASTKRSFLLKNFLSKSKYSFDYIIAHNIGTLYPAWYLSQKNNIPFFFDVEDYYPGEYIINDSINEKNRRLFLLKQLLPKAHLVFYASPQIGKKIISLIGKELITDPILINNCFSFKEFTFNSINKYFSYQIPNLSPNLVHFVWFSQNISSKRGLELIIPELARIKEKIHLHLIGDLNLSFNKNWIEPNKEFISIYSPKSQNELNQFICQFDIGLAFELPTIDENRNICLTNKIWAFLQAGLFILATDTSAQVEFIKNHSFHGILCSRIANRKIQLVKQQSILPIDKSLEYIKNNIENIRQSKLQRFNNAKKLSWEIESTKLDKIFN